MGHSPAADIGSLPDELDSPQAKLVYLYLLASNGCTLSELQRGLEMKKLTLLSVLDSLGDQELVEREDDEYVLWQ